MADPVPYSSGSGASAAARLDYLITHFRAALEDEQAERRPTPTQDSLTLPLKKGRRQYRSGHTSYYLFECEPLPGHILDQGHAALLLDAERHTCRLLGLSIDGLALAVDTDLPDVILTCQLIFEAPRLLESLDKKLDHIAKHPQLYNVGLALHAFDPQGIPQPVPCEAPAVPERLNEDQRQAYRAALHQDLTYIIGPPGTGKTDLIAELGRGLTAAGERTLIVSQTNTAIDLIVDTLLEQHPELTPGTVVRLGTPSQDSSDRVQLSTLDALVLEHTVAADTRREDLLKQIQSFEQDLRTTDALLEILRTHHPVLARIHALEDALQINIRQQGLLTATIGERQHTLRDILDSITQRKSMPAVIRLFQTTSREALLEQHVTLAQRQQDDQDTLSELQRIRTELDQSLTQAQAELASLSPTITWDARTWDQDTLLAVRALQVQERMTLLQALQKEEDTIRTAEQRLVADCRILATTLTRCYLSALLHENTFHTVIIDEASMGSAPAMFVACCLAATRVIIVGDFLQLPPISTAKTPEAKLWLGRSLYAIAHVNSGTDPRIMALRIQYRMHPTIATLASRLYAKAGLRYDSAEGLTTGREELTLLGPLPGHPIVFMNTEHAKPATLRDHSGSPYNSYHASVAVSLAQQALRTPGVKPVISIVTPYAAQVKLIDRMLRHANLHQHVRVGTIHQFQGGASDMIIFDTVLTENLTRSMLGSTAPDAHPHLLINVAITRAKGKLVVIGHLAALAPLAKHPDPILWDCVDFAQMQEAVCLSTGVVTPVPAHRDAAILHSTDCLHAAVTPSAPLLQAV